MNINISSMISPTRSCARTRAIGNGRPPRLNWRLPSRWGFHLACLISTLLLGTTDTPAATITVTNGNDSGPGSLRQAVSDASSGDVIQFAGGVTNITLTSGQITIDVSLSINGPGANALTINSSSSGVFIASTNTDAISISDLTIANSVEAISNNSQMTINRCVMANNTSTAITNTGTMSVVDSTISNNTAGDSPAGGIRNDGSMTITRCTISNNSAIDGGGIFNNSGSLSMTDSTISGNLAMASDGYSSGGGIFNNESMTISNCTIGGNLAGV